MRVLVAHHFYSSSVPSGENDAVLRDVKLLRSAGFDVRELNSSSDGMGGADLLGSRLGIHSPAAVRGFDEIWHGWRPDILHVHNLFPLLTGSIVRRARERRVAVLQTVHNYRRTCAAGTHFDGEKICTLCVDAPFPWAAIVKRCYRGSRVQTIPVVVNQIRDRSMWRGIDGHIVLTPYMRDRLIQTGVEPSAITVRPTSVPDPNPEGPSPVGENLLFVGRLSTEKGVLGLIEGWRRSDSTRLRKLEIVGDGPLAADVAAIASSDQSVHFYGRLDAQAVGHAIERAAAVVVPSIWFEGFPTVVSEAYSRARPVLGLANPNMTSVVGDEGWVCPSEPSGLASAIDEILSDRPNLAKRGAKARKRYEREMTPEASLSALISSYEKAMESHERKQV